MRMLLFPKGKCRQPCRRAGRQAIQMSGKIQNARYHGKAVDEATSAVSTGSDRPPDGPEYE